MEPPKISREVLETRLANSPEAAALAQALRAQADEPPLQERLEHLADRKALLTAGRYSLADEVLILRDQRDRADIVALQAGTHKDGGLNLAMGFQHAEAFMLMTYVSEGGHLQMRIWNSRDGVTPFSIVIDNIKYTHDLKMKGPFFDRPEECDAQWETRTVRAMMAAWGRSLDRAVLLGRLDRVKAEAAKLDAAQAQAWNLQIGLRSLESGKFTDEA
jgi:hypothetical protein